MLAEQYLATFEVGLISARALFAARRMGKSQFLEKDLIPAARARGYVTAYVNLWDARRYPLSTLLAVIGRAVEPTGWHKLLKRLKRPLKHLKASAKVSGMVEGTLEAALADEPASVTQPLLSELIRGFSSSDRRMLLVLDEAQVLAAADQADLSHALRAALDSRKANIKVVFAGSSEVTLRRMFGRAREPFYNWAALEPFELLGREFVQSMVTKVNRLSRFPLNLEDALHAYEALHRTPEFLRRFLTRYLEYAELGVDAALTATRSHIFNDQHFAEVWTHLTPAARIALRLLARGQTDLFSSAARARFASKARARQRVTLSHVQNALRVLLRAELIVRQERGEYQIVDPMWVEWLRERAHVP